MKKSSAPFASARGALVAGLCVGLGGCSTIKHTAASQLSDALAGSGTVFASDNDPELVRAAAPFSLKLMESLLSVNPEHRGLLLAAASGFTEYSYAFVQQDADELAEKDFAASRALRDRARRLYLRARDYGLRGLDTTHPGFTQKLRSDPAAAVRTAGVDDVPLLYWTAAAWGAAIALSKDNADLIADQALVEALIDRALELNERFDYGAIHGFLITYEMARQGAVGEPAARARKHFARAMELGEGGQAGPLVNLAEAVALARQDRPEFEALLRRALAIEADARPEWRLLNLTMQRRARWLLGRADELFLSGPENPPVKQSP